MSVSLHDAQHLCWKNFRKINDKLDPKRGKSWTPFVIVTDLLEEAGVDTVAELSRRNAENLHAKILEVNEAKQLVRRPPALSMVQNWIEQAKGLPRKVEY